MKLKYLIALTVISLTLVTPAMATSYVNAARSLTELDNYGLLINLGIHNYTDAATAVMLYNYIAVALIMLIASFAGSRSESRFTVIVPIFTILMVWFGWLRAPDVATFWGTVIGLLLLGVFLYMNDRHHETAGLPGPGNKVLTIAIMIIVFEAAVTLGSTTGFNVNTVTNNMALTNEGQTQICNGMYGYTCDATGAIDYQSSVSSVQNIGGWQLDVLNLAKMIAESLVGIFIFIIKIIGAIVLFSFVLYTAYPALHNTQTIALLAAMQLVIWFIYTIALFNWFYKPNPETAGA